MVEIEIDGRKVQVQEGSMLIRAAEENGTFIPHFGGDAGTILPIPDDGADIPLGRLRLRAIPAHYLHSSGNLHLYESEAEWRASLPGWQQRAAHGHGR